MTDGIVDKIFIMYSRFSIKAKSSRRLYSSGGDRSSRRKNEPTDPSRPVSSPGEYFRRTKIKNSTIKIFCERNLNF